MPKSGQKIVKSINSFKVKGVTVEHHSPGTHDQYTLKNKNYRVDILINPPQWVGMEFHWQEQDRKFRLEYRIDTDLYDLSDPSNQWFADEIEDQIVEFLEILKEGKLLVGEKKGKPALIIPFHDESLLLRGGKFWPNIERAYKDLEKAKSGGEFKPYKSK